MAPAILSGNSVIAVVSERHPLPAATFSEILATSDLPAGVANILTGRRSDLLTHLAGHMDVNAIVNATGSGEIEAKLRTGTALNLKRYTTHTLSEGEWFGEKAEDPYWILDTIEYKTAWHPIGL
jgi:acyl-CoA reductase-like NAD-dependent aldehyde dehydrogenase